MKGRTLLFAGSDFEKKERTALQFARELLGAKVDSFVHPDLHLYRPEGKVGLHTMASMRQLIDEVPMPPHESKYKIFIIYNAERMQPASANALLKTLEEPNPDTTLILFAEEPKELLPTLLSRCQVLYFPGKPQVKVHAKLVQLLASPPAYPILVDKIKEIEADLEGVEGIALFKEQQILLETFVSWFRDLNLLQFGGNRSLLIHQEAQPQESPPPLAKVLEAVAQAQLELERSAGLVPVLENLCLRFLRVLQLPG